jgi:hypothetical protein
MSVIQFGPPTGFDDVVAAAQRTKARVMAIKSQLTDELSKNEELMREAEELREHNSSLLADKQAELERRLATEQQLGGSEANVTALRAEIDGLKAQDAAFQQEHTALQSENLQLRAQADLISQAQATQSVADCNRARSQLEDQNTKLLERNQSLIAEGRDLLRTMSDNHTKAIGKLTREMYKMSKQVAAASTVALTAASQPRLSVMDIQHATDNFLQAVYANDVIQAKEWLDLGANPNLTASSEKPSQQLWDLKGFNFHIRDYKSYGAVARTIKTVSDYTPMISMLLDRGVMGPKHAQSICFWYIWSLVPSGWNPKEVLIYSNITVDSIESLLDYKEFTTYRYEEKGYAENSVPEFVSLLRRIFPPGKWPWNWNTFNDELSVLSAPANLKQIYSIPLNK